MQRLAAPRAGRAIVLLLLAAIAAGGCSQQRPVGPAASGNELPDQEINDFALTETDAGKPLWKLNARYAAEYSARNTILARALRVDFYDDKGARSSVLTAREGEINGRTRDMVARGHVLLETTEGSRLSTEELRFLNREQKIVVPDNQLVRVQHGHDVLTGYGFESDPDLSHYSFKRRIEATVRSRVPIEEESP
jgi:LPS export ABC transporter protein LptC